VTLKHELTEDCIYIYDEGIKREFRIKNYSFIQDLGSGANGFVVKALHKITGRFDAIKIWYPNKKSKNGEVNREQYIEEIQKIASLNFEQVATIYDADIESNIFYCVMEFIDGHTLEDVIEGKGWFDSFSKIEIARNMLKAIKRYQEKGVIHGDIHSKNIMVLKNKDIKIIDFGTSIYTRENKPSSSKDRECVFTYDNTRRLLSDNHLFPEEYFDDFLLVKCNDNNPKSIRIEQDVRDYPPLAITEVLLSFVDFVSEIFTQCTFESIEALADMANHICIAPFFDITSILDSVYKSTKDEEIIKKFLSIIDDRIFDTMNPMGECEEFFFTSLFAYYSYINNNNKLLRVEKGGSLSNWKHMGGVCDYISFAEDTMSSKLNSFDDVNNIILNCIDSKNYYNFIHFLRDFYYNYIKKSLQKRGETVLSIHYRILQEWYLIKINNDLMIQVDAIRDIFEEHIIDSDHDEDLESLSIKLENAESFDHIKKPINL